MQSSNKPFDQKLDVAKVSEEISLLSNACRGLTAGPANLMGHLLQSRVICLFYGSLKLSYFVNSKVEISLAVL